MLSLHEFDQRLFFQTQYSLPKGYSVIPKQPKPLLLSLAEKVAIIHRENVFIFLTEILKIVSQILHRFAAILILKLVKESFFGL